MIVDLERNDLAVSAGMACWKTWRNRLAGRAACVRTTWWPLVEGRLRPQSGRRRRRAVFPAARLRAHRRSGDGNHRRAWPTRRSLVHRAIGYFSRGGLPLQHRNPHDPGRSTRTRCFRSEESWPILIPKRNMQDARQGSRAACTLILCAAGSRATNDLGSARHPPRPRRWCRCSTACSSMGRVCSSISHSEGSSHTSGPPS